MQRKVNKRPEERNIHGANYGDIFVIRCGGINVFLEVVKLYKNEVAVTELETYKYKDTNKIFRVWKEKNPGKKVSNTGWAEILKKKHRYRKSGTCHLVPLSSKNNSEASLYILRTGMDNNETILYVPINKKTRLYWEVTKIKGYSSEGLMKAKIVTSSKDSYKERHKKLFIFYPYIPEFRDDEEVAEA